MNSYVSDQDERNFSLIRQNVENLMRKAGSILAEMQSSLILDIAPQDHAGIRPFSPPGSVIDTFDLHESSGATIIGDICGYNEKIAKDRYDAIVCTEVLEHVSNPFHAVTEIYRILKPNGILFARGPFNFRIHGPLPDNWRISEHGWRELLKGFSEFEITPLIDYNRFLMPIHYTVIARK